MDFVQDKRRLREHVGSLRDALPAEEHRHSSLVICDRLWQAFAAGLSSGLAAYMPHRSEANITPLLTRCWREGVPVALPKAVPAERRLQFYRVSGHADLAPGAYGIREPRGDSPLVETAELAAFGLMLVPGLAFDATLARLGYGSGYYDRLLAGLTRAERPPFPVQSPHQAADASDAPSGTGSIMPVAGLRPLLVAAAFELQLLPHVPTESHDVRLDAIVTERRIVRV